MTEETKTTAKDFFLHLGFIASLYASVISLITFIFSVIDKIFPDTLSYYDVSTASITTSVSVLIVMFPIFITISRINYRSIDAVPEKQHTWVRRWSLYFTLFLLGLTLAITLITLLNTFLSGEITTRFILKVISIALVASGAFAFYTKDIKGDFIARPKTRRLISRMLSIIMIAVVVVGIVMIGSPRHQRDVQFDSQRVSDLTTIQSEVVNYWQTYEELPETMSDLEDPLTYFRTPIDPENKTPYTYNVTGPLSFELCATFATESLKKDELSAQDSMYTQPYLDDMSYHWEHAEGYTCFERTIDPTRFPTYDR